MAKLESLRIKNFQSHKGTRLQFGPGLNIIKGRSDSGKSAVIRVLNWIFFNRPRGTAFVSWDAKKGQPTFGELLTSDDDVLRRQRKGTASTYHINDKEYGVVGNNAPIEIHDVLAMDRVNFSSQHEGYFLLSSSPGEVALSFSRLVGLEVIDIVRKHTTARINKTLAKKEFIEGEIISKADALKESRWVKKAVDVSVEIDALLKKQSALAIAMDRLASLRGDLAELSDKLKQGRFLMQQRVILHDFEELLESYIQGREELITLANAVIEIEEVQEDVEQSKGNLAALPVIGDLEQLLDSFSQKEEQVSALQKVLNDFDNGQAADKRTVLMMEHDQKSIDGLKDALGVCPICATPFKRSL